MELGKKGVKISTTDASDGRLDDFPASKAQPIGQYPLI